MNVTVLGKGQGDRWNFESVLINAALAEPRATPGREERLGLEKMRTAVNSKGDTRLGGPLAASA